MQTLNQPSVELLDELHQNQLWLTSRGKEGSQVAFSFEKKTSLDLRSIVLTGAILQETDFSYSNLEEAILVGALANGALFECADINRTDFTKAELVESVFKNANGNSARFVKANVRQADFEHASLVDADFRECSCLKTNFNMSNLSGASFLHSILAEASFSGTNLAKANFTGSVISSGTIFEGALNLSEVIVDDIKYEGKNYTRDQALILLQNLAQPSLIRNKLVTLYQLLATVAEKDWAARILELQNKLETASVQGKKQVSREGLNFFGGMGSLNDIVLHRNGIPLLEENDKLDTLRNEIYSELVEISRG
jgi:uncharacterized protein YjbI with pentapeptide repeats